MAVDKPLLPIDDLVALVYRGPLESPPWRGFLEALEKRMGSRGAAMVLRLSRQGLPPIVIWGRRPDIDDAQARAIRDLHAELGDDDPLRNALGASHAIHTLDEVIDRASLQHNRFYQQVLKPYGLERMIGMYIAEPGGWEGNVGLTNGIDAPDFDDDDKAMLVALRPHLEQALAIFARISREETELRVLVDTLDRLTISTFILNGSGAVVRTNSAAKRILAVRDVVRERDSRLTLVDRAADVEFQEIVAGALAARIAKGEEGFVQALRVEAGAQRHVGVLVRAIGGSESYADEAGPACVVYIAGSGTVQPLERLVTQLFDLTPSEAHLATLLATGFTLNEAADKLGLTENTVRTYCKTILNKVGVSRQTDLVRLILRSVAVLG